MSIPQKEKFTFADMQSWNEQERLELIRGVPVMMAPPIREHQNISMALSGELYYFLKGKKCRVYTAPFAVRLFETEDDSLNDFYTVVEPDISVICDPNKLDRLGCRGAPDMVIEILSPSTRMHDRVVKYNLYQDAGVKEYWIISPEEKSVTVYLLNADGFFEPHTSYEKTDPAQVNVLEGCCIDLNMVFSE